MGLQQRVERLEQLFQDNEQTGVYSYRALCAFVLPEHRGRIVAVCRRLDFYLCEHPSGRWALEFDVEGKPAKYRKTQVYEVLASLLPILEVTKEWFFLWLSLHTNLADSFHTAKAMFKRCY